MSEKILHVKHPIIQEERIINQQYHTYTPYTSSYNNNDEIRIAIQSQDLYVLPSSSYILIEFTTRRTPNLDVLDRNIFFTQNFVAHLFSEMRYELNGFEIDRCRSPGTTSFMKCMVACRSEDTLAYKMYAEGKDVQVQYGTYTMMIPLRFIFGFCDDFKKIIMNCKHELILIRNRSDVNAYRAAQNIVTFTVNKIYWKIQHVTLSDAAKLSMLKTLNRNDDLPIEYRSWDLYELPAVPQSTRHNWAVKTTTQLSKPRFVIVGFQWNRNYVVNNDVSMFDCSNISDVKLYLNNERYPYDNLNTNFTNLNYVELYHMFIGIQHAYYGKSSPYKPVETSYSEFKDRTLFAFDCTKSDETIKKGMVDIRIEIEARTNIPENTAAYCLIIHDNLVWYSPFSSIVHRDI